MTDLVRSKALVENVARAMATLDFKIRWLKQHRSADPLKQMQSEAIVDLYEVVKHIQEAMSSLLPLPGADAVSAARDAASATAVAKLRGASLSSFRR